MVTVDKYSLNGHLNGSDKPKNKDDVNWQRLDYLVLSQIYDSISSDLFQMILKSEATAHDVWTSLYNLFHDNKKARAMKLETSFSQFSKGGTIY